MGRSVSRILKPSPEKIRERFCFSTVHFHPPKTRNCTVSVFSLWKERKNPIRFTLSRGQHDTSQNLFSLPFCMDNFLQKFPSKIGTPDTQYARVSTGFVLIILIFKPISRYVSVRDTHCSWASGHWRRDVLKNRKQNQRAFDYYIVTW